MEPRTFDLLLLELAFTRFQTELDSISADRDAKMGDIESDAEQVRKEAWISTVQVQAESTFIDGFSLSDLYPLCLDDFKQKYDSIVVSNDNFN